MLGSPLEVPISSDGFEDTLVCMMAIPFHFIICQQTNKCFPVGVVCESQSALFLPLLGQVYVLFFFCNVIVVLDDALKKSK
eukprot:11942096-Ditylum_brightwellii.AAC.1